MQMSTKNKVVMTAIGPDRPGLVKEVSSIIHQAGANLEDSRMAILAGDFALIVLFSGATESLELVRQKAEALEQELGLNIHFKDASQAAERDKPSIFKLEVSGLDQPGIVHRISEILAGFEINISSFESRLTPAAFAGTPLFTLYAEVEIIKSAVVDKLQGALGKVCEELQLSWDLEE
jgi:glycine cleavage system transcriptional repressor